jgi:hypothetical protein
MGFGSDRKKWLANSILSVIVNYNTSSPRAAQAAGVIEMQARFAQYSNEFISLVVMALMSIALIAGQAGAIQVMDDEPVLDIAMHVMISGENFSIRHEGE